MKSLAGHAIVSKAAETVNSEHHPKIRDGLLDEVLVAIVKKRLGAEASLYTILQILSLTLFEKTNLNQLLNDADLQTPGSVDSNQLNLFN